MFSQDHLDNLRKKCDPLADQAVSRVVEHYGMKSLHTSNILNNVKRLADDGVHECMIFLELLDRKPTLTVDWTVVEIGRRFFVRNVDMAGVVLMYGSLVSSFTAAKGNKVLLATGHLTNYGDVQQRLFETLAFVKVVVLGSESEIRESCCKVRLLHAAVRYYINHTIHDWDYELDGHPINQEDISATLSTFCAVVLHGLHLFGITGSKEEYDGYVALWNYVGYYLGITEDLVCKSFEEQWKLTEVIRERQCHPDQDSQILTQSLLRGFSWRIPFYFSYSFSSDLSRYILGEELSDELCLQKMSFSSVIIINLWCWLNKAVNTLQYYCSPFERLRYRFGQYALRNLVETTLHKQTPSYAFRWTTKGQVSG